MAIKGSNYWTYRDFASGKLPNGNFDPDVINMIAENNPFMNDILWKQCNKGREDITTIKTGMPTATIRAFYQGVVPSKGAKKQVANSCATISSMLRFDWRAYQAEKDKAAFLKDEHADHSEVVTAGVAKLLAYGDTKSNPEAINGWSTIYGDCATDKFTDDQISAFYCLDGSHKAQATAAEALRSIYLIGWGSKSMYATYPEGSNAGIDIGTLRSEYDDDEQDYPDGEKRKMLWGIQEFNHDVGLTCKDYRRSGRICNIDLARAFDASGVPDYTELIRRLVFRRKEEGTNAHFYMCRQMFEVLSVQFSRKTQDNAIKYGDLQQKLDSTILGIPVSFNDVFSRDEARVPSIAA